MSSGNGRPVELSEAQIAYAIETVRSGSATIKTMAEQLKVSSRTLQRHFKKKGVGVKPDPAKSQEIATAAAEAARLALMGGNPAEHAKKIYETREATRKAHQLAERWSLQVASYCLQNKIDPATKLNTFKALVYFTNVLKNTQAGQFEALGIGTNLDPESDVLPELMIKIMGEKEVQQVREATKELGDDLGLPAPELPLIEDEGVVIEGDDSEPAAT